VRPQDPEQMLQYFLTYGLEPPADRLLRHFLCTARQRWHCVSLNALDFPGGRQSFEYEYLRMFSFIRSEMEKRHLSKKHFIRTPTFSALSRESVKWQQ
jgi:hypothetical protein